ncbi:pyruvate, phosphate dikinase [Macrococcoides caseolyticum]|uniref:pyruvate, phosphate dikinase n=1 Tax=Macrococcoides caseolyticum TaxID=69966 RepID=UPI001F384942|nr:pyruvate, phosphate dikinase [Macrococcus caseolyticus]MCE4957335.1 pyruvate, phosphate dikinase [Macrococcus caseolyticus]
MSKFVYAFEEGSQSMKDLLGGKGANLSEMMRLGLPVPNGFTITTEACITYLNQGERLSDELLAQLDDKLTELQNKTNKAFSSDENLLLVSVRSGAKISMPGMMDTILNLGLNDENVEKLAAKTNDARFAYDCYRRLLQMFGSVVYNIPMSAFEEFFESFKKDKGHATDADVPAEDLKVIVEQYKEIYIEEAHKPFPQEPKKQLTEAIEAVFKSWNNDRARIYRDLNEIPHDIGTAVNVQEMVFGNSGDRSGTGVAFTRNPATGEHKLYGEYLLNAQGEDVVAGIRTPKAIETLNEQMPHVYEAFVDVTKKLESHYKDMQDIEFTIENEKLFILQTRNGKRTAKAAINIAVDMVHEGVISKEDAVAMVDVKSIDQLLHPTFKEEGLETAELVSDKGLPASPGAATGQIVFSAQDAKAKAEAGDKVILVRPETSPEDIEGMIAAEAIVTTHGGMTSHAAVVARGMGKCCVTGCSDLEINTKEKIVKYAGKTLSEGDTISVNGSTGAVYIGAVETTKAEASDVFEEFMGWAEEIARLSVRMNAETDLDIKAGYSFNAKGIGLVRTEHMFFGEERLIEMRRFILASTYEERVEALNKIKVYQTEDFEGIFNLSQDRPSIVRLLDPPLHEFLPKGGEEVQAVADQLGVTTDFLDKRIAELHEFNPMLGHRGCRLAITYPELYEMQTEAIITAVLNLKEKGIETKPEIMIPLVSTTQEFVILKDVVKKKAQEIMDAKGVQVNYLIGTMIETPRACLVAGELAKHSEFFSFGTNDLTQLTYGFSRDDAGKFINEYINREILAVDPFQTLDVEGMGQLIKIAVQSAKSANPAIKIGVCGELGGDPKSIHFFNELDIDYVSCSPFRVPGAILATAQSQVQ